MEEKKKRTRKKSLCDYAWTKFFWADLFSETTGMTDAEFRLFFVQAYQSWRANDIEGLPLMFQATAKQLMEISESRSGNISQHKPTHDGKEQQNTASSSISYSSLNSSSSSEGMQGERIDEVVASCGIPKWAGQYGAVPNGLRRANTDGIANDKDKIIIGIKNYAKKILAEKTESKFISDIDNWLATGQWLKYQVMSDIKTKEPQKEDDFMKKWNAQKALYNR